MWTLGRRLRGLVGVVVILAGVSVAWADEMEQKTKDFVQQLAQKLTEQRRTTVAVLDFSRLDDGAVNPFCRALAEELVTRLVNLGTIQVVEKRFLDKILQEHKWSLSDLVNPQTAVRFGQLSGVQAILTGSIADEGSYLRVNGRLISTETGFVFASAGVQFFKDERIARLWDPAAAPTAAQRQAPAPPVVPQPQAPPPNVVSAGGFDFLPRGCRRVSGTLECTVTVTNTGSEQRKLTFYTSHFERSSFLVDDQGRRYPTVITTTPQREGVGEFIGAVIGVGFPSQVPVNIYIRSREVDPGATQVTGIVAINEMRSDVVLRGLRVAP